MSAQSWLRNIYVVCTEGLLPHIRPICDLSQKGPDKDTDSIQLKEQFLSILVVLDLLTRDAPQGQEIGEILIAYNNLDVQAERLDKELIAFEALQENKLLVCSGDIFAAINSIIQIAETFPSVFSILIPLSAKKSKKKFQRNPLPVLFAVKEFALKRRELVSFLNGIKPGFDSEEKFQEFQEMMYEIFNLRLGTIVRGKLQSEIRKPVAAVEAYLEGPSPEQDFQLLSSKKITFESPKTENEPPKEIKDARFYVVKEICGSESSYLVYIKQLVLVYMEPLLAGTGSHQIISEQDIKKIFQNLPELIEINTKFLNNLSTVCNDANWKNPCIGVCFIEHLSQLTVYSKYTQGLPEAQERLRKLIKKNPKFAGFLKTNARDPYSLPEGSEDVELQASIIMPLQRIMRYVLLLKSLDEATPVGDPDKKSVESALASAMALANDVNQAVADADNVQEKEKEKPMDKLKKPKRYTKSAESSPKSSPRLHTPKKISSAPRLQKIKAGSLDSSPVHLVKSDQSSQESSSHDSEIVPRSLSASQAWGRSTKQFTDAERKTWLSNRQTRTYEGKPKLEETPEQSSDSEPKSLESHHMDSGGDSQKKFIGQAPESPEKDGNESRDAESRSATPESQTGWNRKKVRPTSLATSLSSSSSIGARDFSSPPRRAGPMRKDPNERKVPELRLLQDSHSKDSLEYQKKRKSFLSPKKEITFKLPALSVILFGLSRESQIAVRSWKKNAEVGFKILSVSDLDDSVVQNTMTQLGCSKYDPVQLADADVVISFEENPFETISNLVSKDFMKPIVLLNPPILNVTDTKIASNLVGHKGNVRWHEVFKCAPAFRHLSQIFKAKVIGSLQMAVIHYSLVDNGEKKDLQNFINAGLAQLISVASSFIGNILEVNTIGKEATGGGCSAYSISLISATGDMALISLDYHSALVSKVSTLECKLIGTKGTISAQYPENTLTEELIGSKVKVMELGPLDYFSFLNAILRDIQYPSEVACFTDLFLHLKSSIVLESIHRSNENQVSVRTLDMKKEIFRVLTLD